MVNKLTFYALLKKGHLHPTVKTIMSEHWVGLGLAAAAFFLFLFFYCEYLVFTCPTQGINRTKACRYHDCDVSHNLATEAAEPRLVYCKGIDCISDVVRYSVLVVIHLDI